MSINLTRAFSQNLNTTISDVKMAKPNIMCKLVHCIRINIHVQVNIYWKRPKMWPKYSCLQCFVSYKCV
jgi:hypothetical protein